MKPRALLLIRLQPQYRREAFELGLRQAGFDVCYQFSDFRPTPVDVLLSWNLYGTPYRLAEKFNQVGAANIVVENSYVDMVGTKKAFAMSLYYHNGAGVWPEPEYDRSGLLDVEVLPWKTGGEYILTLPQRGIGSPKIAMPKNWPVSTREKLRRRTQYKVVERQHPGTVKNGKLLEDDLAKAVCAVTWGSGAAIKALINGVPVFYEFKHWIGGSAAHFGIPDVVDVDVDFSSMMGDRFAMLSKLAWAQWSYEEVATGEPIKRLIGIHRNRQ